MLRGEAATIPSQAVDGFEWGVTYLDENRGNVSIRVETDKEVAVKSLDQRGATTMKIRVCLQEDVACMQLTSDR